MQVEIGLLKNPIQTVKFRYVRLRLNQATTPDDRQTAGTQCMFH